MDIALSSPWPGQVLWFAATAGFLTAGLLALRAIVVSRGSTAQPAAMWGLAAGAVLALDGGLRATGVVEQPAAAAAVRLVGVVLAVSPILSLLGAKRPQHGVWQFIVAALAAVILFPSAAGALARPGSVPEVHLLARSLVAALVALGWMNSLGTARALPVTLMTVGVFVVARGFLPWADTEASFPPSGTPAASRSALLDCLGAWGIAVGALVAPWAGRRTRRAPRPPRDGEGCSFAARIEPAWFAVRDTFGAAWSLRVAERFDQLAEARGWPVRLRLSGIEPADVPFPSGWQRDATRALEALLRRFVSRPWLARHGWPVEEWEKGRGARPEGSPRIDCPTPLGGGSGPT